MITLALSIILTVIYGIFHEFRENKEIDPFLAGAVICAYIVVGALIGILLYAVGGMIFPNCNDLFCGTL